jgi:hypothetical protein
MTSRERVQRALEFRTPDRVPRNLWRLPGIEMFRQQDLAEVLDAYPEDIAITKGAYGKGQRERGTRYKRGEIASDEWGCEWYAAEDGVAGEVKDPPLTDITQVHDLSPPYEILADADFSSLQNDRTTSETFLLGWTRVRPFERMQFLLGTENLFVELASPSAHFAYLREMLHEFFLEELTLWSQTQVDGLLFMDDWGSQHNLLISPTTWQTHFKPLYKDYCDLIHASHKFVFFHSDGQIASIYPDLIEIGVDALNSQLFCMDIEELGRKYRGQITFFGEIDRQFILPFGAKHEVIQAVKRLKDVLWMPEGGIIAQCEFGLHDPTDNIKTVFDTWESLG